MLPTSLLLQIIKAQTEIVRIGPDLEALMDTVAGHAAALCDADGAAIELIEGDEMVYRAVAGSASGELGLRVPAAASLSGLCMRTRQLQVCRDTEVDARVDRNARVRLDVRSVLAMPLLHGEACVGVILVFAARPNAFSDIAETVLQSLSKVAAAAMFHAVRLDENELYQRATRDPLTGLANRAMFYDQLRARLTAAARHGRSVGVVLLDMDGLKRINDELGHRAGDEALVLVATALSSHCRAADTVARLGGDEFALILPSAGDLSATGRRGASLTRAVSRQSVTSAGKRFSLGASFGAAVYPDCAQTVTTLLELADQRMYAAKRARYGIEELVAS